MRRLASLLLALAMAFGLTATALAADVVNETGHTYAAYKVFSGTQKEGAEGDSATALGDIEWGGGVDDSTLLPALQKLEVDGAAPFAGCNSAAEVAAVLQGDKGRDAEITSAIAKAFANEADKHRIGEGTPIPADKNATVPLEPGYYLFVDTEKIGEGANDAYNPALLQVTNHTITITAKYDTPIVEKKVKDTEDGELGDAVDVAVGDKAYFVLSGTLPMNLGDYDSYAYTFHDTLSAGLKYDGNVKVYLAAKDADGKPDMAGRTEITAGFTVTPASAPLAGGGKLEVAFENLKAVDGVTADSVILVEYSATLTEAAVAGNPGAGNPGNTNTVKLEYSNNPNTSGGGKPSTGETPEDTVWVFTYGLDGSKVDGGTKAPLGGAKFILYRGKGGNEPSYDPGTGKPVDGTVEYALVATVDEEVKVAGWTASREEAAKDDNLLVSGDDGRFEVAGLDAGGYYLEETEAPAGYNLLKDPVKLTISATIGANGEAQEVTGLEITTEGKDGPATKPGNPGEGTVSLEVQNNMGALLPSTGGMGTTLFYIAGAALVLAAGALLVLKRRTNAGE